MHLQLIRRIRFGSLKMVFTEQVRQLASEANLINDSATYTRNNAAWGTFENLREHHFKRRFPVVFKFTFNTTSAYRLKIGSYYVYGCFTTGYKTGIAFVAAGTYAVVMEQKNGGGGGSGNISAFQLGKAKFSDVKTPTLPHTQRKLILLLRNVHHPVSLEP